MTFSDLYKNVLITTNDSLNAKQLEDHLSEKLKSKERFPENSEIIILAGIHHSLDEKNSVKVDKTDFALVQGFYYKLFSTLAKLKNPESGNFIWDEMKYQSKVILLASKENLNRKTFQITYELSDLTKRDLKSLAKDLLISERPSVVVFASCFSQKSSITDFLISNTVLASLNLSKERGDISGGRVYGIDNEQREILLNFMEVGIFDYNLVF